MLLRHKIIYQPLTIKKAIKMFDSVKKGDKVVITASSAKNGYPNDQENVKTYLKIGEEYTLTKVIEKNWITDVYLQEVPEIKFNSVNFVTI
jgi:hypothetical protein